jgi:PilZ domain-containing protein
MHSINTRRWPRFHVHLPVLIAGEPGPTRVLVPGLVSEISRRGMELYGGVQRRPGDLMEVEFRTGRMRVAGVVRNRSGYCFGLEFLSIATASQALTPMMLPSGEALPPGMAANDSTSTLDADAAPTEDTYAELFIERHEAYLHDMQRTIARLREKTLEIRQFRLEMELLLRGDSSQH